MGNRSRHFTELSHLVPFQDPNEEGTVFIPILQLRKLKGQRVKQLSQGHPASKGQSWDANTAA